MRKQTLITFLLLCFACLKLAAQPYQLTLSINVNPPYSADYTDYFSSLNQISVTIINSSPTAQNIYLAGSIATTDGAISVRTNEGERWPGAALSIPAGPSTTMLNGTDLQPFTENSDIEYSGITAQDIISGILPEGEYRVCLRAYDYTNYQAVSADHCSNTFTIAYPQPPTINTPECGESIARTAPQNILFNWQTPMGIPSSAQARYRFTLVQLPDGIDAVSALENATDPIYTTETQSTSLMYGIAQPNLISPRTYAWRVQVYDATGGTQFQNEGYSEPCTFNYLEPGNMGNPFTLVFPLEGDTLPWEKMPIMHRFDPYSVEYIHYSHQFTLRRNGTQVDTYNADNGWPQGPQQTQSRYLSGITQEQSQHLNLYKPLSAEGVVPFNAGETFDWNANIQIRHSSDNNLNGSLSGSFVSGMGRPRPIAPMNNDSVEKNMQLTLRFTTSAPPARLTPPFALMQTSGANHIVNFFNSGIDERWLLEVSRTQDFATVIASKSKRIGQGLSYNTTTCPDQCLLDSLYRDETFLYTPADTGDYYWRVRWLLDPSSASGPTYHDGPIWKFIVKDSLSTTTEPPAPEECVNTCDGPIIYPSERVPVSTAAVGNTVAIGLFSMNITEINWGGTTASGKGTIHVPLMRAPIKVRFSSIKINASNRVYEGEVIAEYDNESIVPAGIMQGVSQIASLNETQARQLDLFVNSAGRLVSMMMPNNPMGLPIGLDNTMDDHRVTIGVVGMKFTPETARMNAMVSMDVPGAHGWLSLGATDICFHPNGLGGDGRAMLYLPLDHVIPFGDSISLRFNRTRFSEDFSTVLDSGTFVSWDCRGFRSLAIDGAVVFGRDMLVEDLPDGREGTHQIEAEFTAKVRRRNQWLTRINFNHPFQVKGSPGWGFEVEEAWLDFADTENPTGFRFPNQYAFDTTLYNPSGVDISDEDASLYWKGFYLKRQSIRIPPEFKTYSDPSNRLSFAVNDMLIDRSGLSASFRLENLFEVTDGNLNGWGFSMDTLLVDVVQNSFSRGGFVGEIQIPISDSALVYSSMIHQNIVSKNFSYELRVTPKSSINANLWAAQLALDSTCYIEATIDSAGVFARAELSGKMNINADFGDFGTVNFQLMEFQNLGFQTRSPYIDCAECLSMGFASPQKFMGGSSSEESDSRSGEEGSGGLGGFPVNIEGIGLKIAGGGDDSGEGGSGGSGGLYAGIEFTLTLNLTGESNTFSAATKMSILGKLNIEGGARQAWEFDRIELDSIGISGSVGVVELAGGLRFYNNDMTYGNGFKGMIRATFKPAISIQVVAQFGEKSGFRYWMVDAQAVFGSGIPLITGLELFGFGGGAWYHMRRTSPLPSAADLNVDPSVTSETPETDADEEDAPPGLTLTGVTFVPDQSIGFGFEATVVFGSNGKGDAYNADVSFGAEFTSTGGISQMYLEGNGYFMCDINDRNNPQIHAEVRIAYDFTHDIFDARFAVTVNVAGGVLRGVNEGGLAGEVHIYASPETWFIHAGTPTTPMGLNVAGIFETESYLMVGMNLPPAPEPPAEVMSVITPSVIARHPGLENGDGFAFGTYTRFKPRFDVMPIYASLDLQMGFDIALKNYGPDVFCEGSPPGTTIGVDGWYADGQAYAYIGMDIGLYVDLWVVSGRFSIINASMAALLQVGLPNPSWIQGTCGGQYNILNGLVRGNCQFEFKEGEECRPAAQSPLAGIDILEDLVPYNGEQNVDCGTNPEASFNAEVDTPFDINEVLSDGSKRMRRFRFVVERFELKKGTVLVQTRRTTSPDKFKSSLVPAAFLDPFTNYTVSIKLRGEEYNFATSAWGPAYKTDGSLIVAEQSNTFNTGAYPDRIPDNAVQFSYPFNTQRYFLQGECNDGLVRIKSTMDPLFATNPTPTTIRKFNVRFIPVDGGPEINTALNYGGTSITFEIPPLLNNKVYACQLISKDSTIYTMQQNMANMVGTTAGAAGSLAGSAITSSQLASVTAAQFSTLQQTFASLGSGAEARNNRINGRSVRKNEKLLYVFFFRTSQHNTLIQKMQAQNPSATGTELFGSITWLEPKYTGGEKFDAFDVNGFPYIDGTTTPMRTKSLVYFGDPRSGNWNTTYTTPVIYDLYQLFRTGGYTSLKLLRSTPDTLGIPPRWTVRFDTDYIAATPLLPTEFLPQSLAPNSVFSNLSVSQVASTAISTSSGFGSFGGFSGLVSAPSSLHLKVSTGLNTYFDYQRMVTIGNNVMATYGHPSTSEFYPYNVKTKFLQFLGYGWRPMYTGNYEVNYYYRTPAFLCQTLDDFTPVDNRKPYTY